MTPQQIQQNIISLEKQGASQKDIQSWLDSLKTSNIKTISNQSNIEIQEQPENKTGILDRVKNFGIGMLSNINPSLGIALKTETGQNVIKGAAKIGAEGLKSSEKPFLQPFAMASGKDIPETSISPSVSANPTTGELAMEAIDLGLTATSLKGGSAVAKQVGKQIQKKTLENTAEMTLKSGKTKQLVSRDAWEVIKPELSKTEKVSKLMSGQAKEQGLLKEVVLKPTQQELKIAQAVENIVSPKKSFVENIYSVKQEIVKEANNVIKGLEKNNTIYPKKELNAVLDRIEKPISVKADPILNNYYDLAKEKFLEFSSKEKGNLSGLLKARKKFDSWIEQEIPKIWDDPKMSGLNKALKDMRMEANNFIASKLPTGNLFKKSLEKQSLMFDAIDNISTKNYKQVGTNVIQRTLQKNPTLKAGLKYGAGGVGLGWVGSKVLGD